MMRPLKIEDQTPTLAKKLLYLGHKLLLHLDHKLRLQHLAWEDKREVHHQLVLRKKANFYFIISNLKRFKDQELISRTKNQWISSRSWSNLHRKFQKRPKWTFETD